MSTVISREPFPIKLSCGVTYHFVKITKIKNGVTVIKFKADMDKINSKKSDFFGPCSTPEEKAARISQWTIAGATAGAIAGIPAFGIGAAVGAGVGAGIGASIGACSIL